jgi:S1-C subfamily serine protease
LKLNVNQGVLVNRVNSGSAAEKSGMAMGDVIIGIDDHVVNSVSELQEWVARNRPGKEISVTFLRNGLRQHVNARLKNNEGNERVTKKDIRYHLDGASMEDVQYTDLNKLQLEGGVRIKELHAGKWKAAGMKRSFIIAHIDKIPVDNVEDLNRILEFKRGGILIEGFYPGGEKGTYGMNLE